MSTTAVASHWGTVALRDCCDIVAGSTPSREVAQFWDGPIPWATPKDLGDLDNPVLENTPEGITQEGFDSCSTQMLPKGAVLFSSRAPIGLVAIAGRPMCTNQGFKSFVPGPGIDSLYLYYCLKSMVPQIQARGNGATFKEVSKEVIGTFEIPIPFPDDPRRSLAEQKRIAAILDKADAIRRRRQEAARFADNFGLAALVHIAGDPINNPHSWDMQPLQSVCSTITDGEHLNPVFTSKGVPMVMAANVREDGVDLINTKSISEEDYERFTRKCNPQRNDVLVVSRGATIGRCTRVDTDHRFALMGSVILLKLNHEKMLPTYLQVLLTHPAYRARLFTTSSASAQQAIYLSHIKKLLVPVPPMSVQRDHCRFVEWVDAHRTRMRVGWESVEELFAALVQRAFRGEL